MTLRRLARRRASCLRVGELGQRRLRVGPRDVAGVGARVAAVAVAHRAAAGGAELQRAVRRRLADHVGDQLVDRDVVEEVDLRLEHVGAGQERRGAAGVVARALRLGGVVRQARDDHGVTLEVAHRVLIDERRQDLGQLVVRALGLGRPRLHVDPAGQVIEQGALGRGLRGRVGATADARRERFEPGEGDQGAGATEHRATREGEASLHGLGSPGTTHGNWVAHIDGSPRRWRNTSLVTRLTTRSAKRYWLASKPATTSSR